MDEIPWNAIASTSTALGLIVTIVALVVESRRTRAINEIQLLNTYDAEFREASMCAKRRAAAQFLLGVLPGANRTDLPAADRAWDVVSDVLDFFQGIGTAARHGHIRDELVYKFCFYWFANYWSVCKPYVGLHQSRSRITWADAAWLYERLEKYDRKQNAGSLSRLTAEQQQDFFRWEAENTCREPGNARSGVSSS